MASSNYEKMLAGEAHDGTDPVFMEMQREARQKKARFDAISEDDREARLAAMQDLFGSMAGPAIIKPPFTLEYGCHIHLGAWVFINSGATFLDSNLVTIGSRTAIGPNVQFITATHPVKPEERFTDAPDGGFLPFRVQNIAKPITIGSQCWIGAGTILMPGVTIGDGTTVGAGSLVTKSLPERVVALGSPARVVRSVDE